jgi:hypothetical protein
VSSCRTLTNVIGSKSRDQFREREGIALNEVDECGEREKVESPGPRENGAFEVRDPVPWLYRVAFNRCLDHRRRFARRTRLFERLVGTTAAEDWIAPAMADTEFKDLLVKRVLWKHGYPPDKQEKATQTVLEQAELRGEFVG